MDWRVLALTAAIAAAPAQAEIYKWILPDGSVAYSDRPPAEGAERVELSPLITYSPSVTPESEGDSATEDPGQADGYVRFYIASPANEATIRDNAGEITLNFTIDPSLMEGHAIEVFMDGQMFGHSTAPVVTLSGVDRGTHQIYATIVDDAGVELARSGTVTVHLRRASSLL